jgi:hypothetical protein
MFFSLSNFDIQASELVQILENINHYTDMWRYFLSLTSLLKGLTQITMKPIYSTNQRYVVPPTGNFTEENFPSRYEWKQNLVNF